MAQLSFDPPIPMGLWLALAVAGAAVLAWYALRRPGMLSRRRWGLSLGLMSAGLIAVLVLLLNPIWSRELPPPPGKPVLTVLLDASSSMATQDGANGASRFKLASEMAHRLGEELQTDFEVRVKAFDRSVKPTDLQTLENSPDPSGVLTDISAAINAGVNGDVAAGEAIILLSDGIHNTGGGSSSVLSAVRVAKAMDVPIYTATFGGDASRVDLAVQIKSPQDLAIVGQRLPITVRVTHVGLAGGRAEVVLMQGGKEVARRTALLTTTGTADVHFMITQDKVGVYPYEVRIEPFPGEASQVNNSASYVLRMVDEPIRVLVLEGKPYWDSKFFTRTLVTDPAVALDAVVKLTDKRLMRRVFTHTKPDAKEAKPKLASADDATPEPAREESWQITGDAAEFLSSPEKLRGYRIVVLGRDAEAFLSDQAAANLQEWVARDGGALVCYRGSPTATSSLLLARLLPVKWSPSPTKANRFRMSLTSTGEEMEWLGSSGDDHRQQAIEALAGMPSLASASVADISKPLAIVLARSHYTDGSETPAVVYQPYGSGRVVVIEGAGMWRWAFLAPQYQQQEQIYASLWHSLMRWLTSGASLQPGQEYSLKADKIRFDATEAATVTLLAREEKGSAGLPAVELFTMPDDGTMMPSNAPTKSVAPGAVGGEAGMFRINFGPLPQGRYQARLAGSAQDDAMTQVIFDVRNSDQEQLDLQSRPDLMARIATDSGGATLNANASDEVGKLFKAHQLQTRPPQFERTSAWDRWWILGGVIALWTISWFVRRSGGLV